MIQHMERDLLETQLQTRRDIALAIGQRRTRFTRAPERLGKIIREDAADHWRAVVPGHLDAFRVMTEVVEIQTKLSALFSANNLAKLINETRLAVRRET